VPQKPRKGCDYEKDSFDENFIACGNFVVFFLGAGCIPTVRYEKVVHLSEPAGGSRVFEAETHNGSIRLK